jgi:transposase
VQDIEFQEKLLGIARPWRVTEVVVDRAAKTVETKVIFEDPTSCPECGKLVPRHDHRERRWRHLDLYEYQAHVTARVPRVECPEHGVQQLSVPWAEGRGGFTALFERLAISLLAQMTISAVAKTMGLSWSEVDTIMRRAVLRGLDRRKTRTLRRIGIDEKSVKKRHIYFTIVTDLERNEVVWVGRGRKRETLDAFWRGLSPQEREAIEGVAMDMHEPYFRSTLEHVPDAANKIVFDKFHVSMYLTRAVDATRRAVMKAGGVAASGLKHTRQLWLFAKKNLAEVDQKILENLSVKYERIGSAWTHKELFAEFWKAATSESARAFFAFWRDQVLAGGNAAMIEAMKTLERHLDNLVTYAAIHITNAASESMNSRIQLVKFRSRGFRSAARFERAIMFHCGGLDMSPAT